MTSGSLSSQLSSAPTPLTDKRDHEGTRKSSPPKIHIFSFVLESMEEGRALSANGGIAGLFEMRKSDSGGWRVERTLYICNLKAPNALPFVHEIA